MQMENANRVLFASTTKAIVPVDTRPSRFLFFRCPSRDIRDSAGGYTVFKDSLDFLLHVQGLLS